MFKDQRVDACNRSSLCIRYSLSLFKDWMRCNTKERMLCRKPLYREKYSSAAKHVYNYIQFCFNIIFVHPLHSLFRRGSDEIDVTPQKGCYVGNSYEKTFAGENIVKQSI